MLIKIQHREKHIDNEVKRVNDIIDYKITVAKSENADNAVKNLELIQDTFKTQSEPLCENMRQLRSGLFAKMDDIKDDIKKTEDDIKELKSKPVTAYFKNPIRVIKDIKDHATVSDISTYMPDHKPTPIMAIAYNQDKLKQKNEVILNSINETNKCMDTIDMKCRNTVDMIQNIKIENKNSDKKSSGWIKGKVTDKTENANDGNMNESPRPGRSG